MNVEKRKRAGGKISYSFVYWDDGKRIRLKKSEHPEFDNYEDALSWAKSKEAEFDSMKARALRRLEWRKKYYDFSILAKEYIQSCKKTQVNSWRNTEFYLYNYVIPFFLNTKSCNNPNSWSLYYEEFKNYLEDDALTVQAPQRSISYSSKNHCIKILNTFSSWMVRSNNIDPGNVHKVSSFGKHKLNTRNADHLISQEEFKAVIKELVEINPKVATLFQLAFFSGMRFSEMYGLSLNSLYLGKIEDGVLSKALEQHQIEYFGYIVLESQPATKTRKREADGSIKRKPLKSRKKICEEYNRIVPLIDKDLFNSLVGLYKEQQELHQSSIFGPDRKSYVLFDGLSTSECSRSLRLAYEKTKYTHKSYHCCRHTRCTELVGTTRDFVLARYWLGHTREEVTQRYTHIFQQSVREVRMKEQVIDFIN